MSKINKIDPPKTYIPKRVRDVKEITRPLRFLS